MKPAFNTAIAPGWDLSTTLAKAAALGYAGVEVHLPSAAEADPAAGSPFAGDDVAKAFEEAGVALVGLSSALRFDDGDRTDDAASAVRRCIELAKHVGSPNLRMLDAVARPGRVSASDLALRLADWLLPLADAASAAGVTLLVQNALAFRTAGPLWAALERADHPAIGVAWDPLAAAAAGETPGVSVPMLNSRIRMAVLRDGALAGTGAARRVEALRPLGDGDADVKRFTTRLRGVGFAGPAVVDYPPTAVASLGGDPEAVLKRAVEQLAKWKPAPAKVGSATAKKPAGGGKPTAA